MGQDQAKPKGASNATASAKDDAYRREEAKMHHVTTKDTMVAAKAPWDAEADRLAALFQTLEVKAPLLTSSVEGGILPIGKRDKLVEEATQVSEVIREHQLFTEDIIRLFAQYQTIELREGSAAAKRSEEITARLSQTVFYSGVLRSAASSAAVRLHNATEVFQEADTLFDAASAMHSEVVDLSQLAMEINGLMTESARMEVKAEVERLMEEERKEERSRSASVASTTSRASSASQGRAGSVHQ